MDVDPDVGSLVGRIRARAAADGDGTALVVQGADGERRAVSTAELDARAAAVAGSLHDLGVGAGERALLLHPPGLDYVAAFLGCLYAGVVAVPVTPPTEARGAERLRAIAGHASPSVALATRPVLDAVRARPGEAAPLCWHPTDGLEPAAGAAPTAPPDPGALAFLQYTSGSTGTPKGVMVTHANIAHNSSVIARALDAGPGTRAVSWLPPYHDMGLIGGILQPLYSGFPCLLLPPAVFLYRPVRWLEAISDFGATSSAAPNFAYAECVRRVPADAAAELDLSRWVHAMVGAEPVRPATLDRFAERFAVAGFARTSFLPCYGLAEATLFVTGVPAADAPSVRVLDPDALARDTVADAPDGRAVVGCGLPIGEDEIAVVDPVTRRRRPGGTVGEVWVRGPSVAAGYWGDDDGTAATFGATLTGREDGRPWMRTGDLGYLDDAGLSITGRSKDLILLHGANLYPQDVEDAAGAAHPALLPGRAAAFALDRDERVVLVSEVAAGRDGELDAAVRAVVAAVGAGCGLALHDVVLVRRGTVPFTASGKVRRRECRDRYRAGTLAALRTVADAPATGPGTPRERLLTTVVAAALDRDAGAIDPRRPLVAQGLDSLAAVRLHAELHDTFGIDADVAELLSTLTVARLAGIADGADRAGGTTAPDPIPHADGPVPASPGQERLWLLDQLGAGAAYHVTGLVRLGAAPDTGAVRRALRVLVDRHESLRTGLLRTDDGRLVQHIVPASDVDVTALDPGGLDAWVAAPFPLDRPPLVRAAVERAADGTHTLALCVHHVVCDGWSMRVLAEEFAVVHAAERSGHPAGLPPPPVTYRDVTAWRRDREPPGDGYRHGAPAGASAPDLTGHPDPGPGPFDGAVLPAELPADLVDGLRRVAAAESATLFAVLVAVWSAVLARRAGTTDVLAGTVLAGRADPRLAGVVGLFAVTLPLRVDLSGDPGARTLVGRARDAALAALRHQDTAVDPRLAAAVRHVLVLQDERPVVTVDGAAVATSVRPPGGARFELELELTPVPGGGLAGTLTHATAVLDAYTARQVLDDVLAVARRVADAPDAPLSTLPQLDGAARALVLGSFSGAGSGPTSTPPVPEWFERTADTTPDAVAVVGPDGTALTYAGLDDAANRLAALLRARGAGRGDRVAVRLERGPRLSTAVLAVLKAGCVYVPVDPDLPAGRVGYLLGAASPSVLVTTTGLDTVAPAPGTPVVRLDACAAELAACRPDRPGVPITPGEPAYVLFTSGSTGRPKGAVNTHAGLTNRLSWARAGHPVTASDRVLHKTPIGFDVSVWELLLPLVCGATLVHAEPGGHRSPAHLRDVLARRAVTVCHFVPSMLRVFLDEPTGELPALRLVVCSGEEMTAALATRLLDRLPHVGLLNLYGPTEAAIDVTGARVGRPVGARVPIGTPAPGVETYVLDERMAPRPVGAAGELYLGGVQIAQAYLDAPGTTAERFVPHPFRAGRRLYATGDRACWMPDGTLRYLGRLDQQVKIRGQRIEPAEIESALEGHPGVSAAVVVARPDGRGDPYLVAYVVAGRADAGELRAHLERTLPPAMVPAVFVPLDALPALPSGKVDRAALPEPDRSGAGRPRVEPRTHAERVVAGIWAEVLECGPVGADDDFLERGGHSLLAVRVLGRIRAALGVELQVGDLLTGRPTVAAIAATAELRQVADAVPDELDALLDELENLPEDDVRRMLADSDEQY